MSQGQPEVAVIQQEGTGAALHFNFGFVPRAVQILNIDAPAEGYWNDLMTDGYVFKRVTAGTASYATSGGVTPYDGASAGEALQGDIATTVNSKTVTGISTFFTEELEVGDLVTIGSVEGRVDAIASNTSLTLAEPAGATQTGKTGYRLTRSGAGITLGTDADLNADGETIIATAWR